MMPPILMLMSNIIWLSLSLHQIQSGAADVIEPSHLQDPSTASSLPPPSSWPGHLKPLGSEADRLPISELTEFPSPTEFFQSYVYPSIPVVFRRGARRSPAFEKWSDKYLKSLPESQDLIDVEMRKVENRSVPPKRMPFAEFLDRYRVYDEYLVTGVPDFLKKDVLVPPPLHCDNITANLVDTVMWFSNGGTKSVLHNDDVDNLNCLFSGQKEILFVNYTKYRHQIVFDHPEGSYSSVNVEQVDFNKYPELRDVEFFEAKMEAGDCIYIPYKWFHQVNSVSRNIAVNIWWNHRANIVPTLATCGSPDPGLSLADVGFFFHDLVNNEKEEVAYPELIFLDNPGQTLMTFMEEEGKPSLNEDEFVGLLSVKLPMLHGGWNKEALGIGHEMFQQMDPDEDGRITLQDIGKLPTQEEEKEEEEEELFGLRLQQKLMMLIDVIDEEIVKQKQKLLRKLVENQTASDSDRLSPPRDHLGKSTGMDDPPFADKDEL